MWMRMGIGLRVPMPARLSPARHHHVEQAMVHAALGRDGVGKPPHGAGRAAQHHRLYALLMVQVHVGGGHVQFVVCLLYTSPSPRDS